MTLVRFIEEKRPKLSKKHEFKHYEILYHLYIELGKRFANSHFNIKKGRTIISVDVPRIYTKGDFIYFPPNEQIPFEEIMFLLFTNENRVDFVTLNNPLIIDKIDTSEYFSWRDSIGINQKCELSKKVTTEDLVYNYFQTDFDELENLIQKIVFKKFL